MSALHEQPRSALQLANKIRLENKLFKEAIREKGRVEGAGAVAEILRDLDSNPTIRSLRIDRVVLAVRGLGASKTNSILMRSHVSATRRTGALSQRQLDAVANELEIYANNGRKVNGC
jgi:hypothetical protein